MAEAKRRLAAILAADVAGYSRLMGDDERATMDTLNAYRDVFRDHTSKHQGRVVDTAGDSVLAAFDSVVEAVQCAVSVQDELETRNADLPDKRKMQFRIGVNLGDIFEQADGTLYGDGVNVAARLESLAQPGSVAVSGTAFDHVDGKLDVAFEDIGEHEVKNINRPVRAYQLAAAKVVESVTGAPALALPDKPSIAVLPFNNLSQDPGQDYFADGISEDLITDLSKISGLFVIARNSAFTFKDRTVKVADVAAELGVRYVLEGSVRKAGNRVRITAQLIDGQDSGHVWAERYDRELDDIFVVQDEVTKQIVSALKVNLTSDEQLNLVHRGTNNLDAYDAFMRGREPLMIWTHASHEEARPWMVRAIGLDPGFADPVAWLAMIEVSRFLNQWGEDWPGGLPKSYELASKAVALDEESAPAHYALGTVQMWKRELDTALLEQERAIELDPNFSLGYGIMGYIQHYRGNSAAALAPLHMAQRLDPVSGAAGTFFHMMALCHFMLGEFHAAESILLQRISTYPSTDSSRVLLASIHGHKGKIEDARKVWSELMDLVPSYSFTERCKVWPYKDPADVARIADGLKAAGIEV